MKLNVLSLFDGMSCGQIAIERSGIAVDCYFASEIDKYAIKVAMANYPNTIQLGSVVDVKAQDLPPIDLLIGGSPCQGFSFAGKQLNFDDERSKLFFEYVRLLEECNPKYFLLENVRMKKEYQDVITSYLGVEPIFINSSSVSAQNRPRLYWTNIPNVTVPEDKGILLMDILEDGIESRLSQGEFDYMSRDRNDKPRFEYHTNRLEGKAACLTANMYKGVPYGVVGPFSSAAIRGRYSDDGAITQQLELSGTPTKSNAITTVQKDSLVVLKNVACVTERRTEEAKQIRREVVVELDKAAGCISSGRIPELNGHDYVKRVYSDQGKSPALCTGSGGNHEPKVVTGKNAWRKLTPLECERLQTVPDNYTNHVSNSQRYKMLGNGWTIDVIAHILKNMKGD